MQTIFLTKFFKGLNSFVVECKKAKLISKTNILLPTETIEVVHIKSANTPKYLRNKRQDCKCCSKSILVYTVLFFIHNTLSVYISRKEAKRMLLFIVNLGHDEVKIIKRPHLSIFDPGSI